VELLHFELVLCPCIVGSTPETLSAILQAREIEGKLIVYLSCSGSSVPTLNTTNLTGLTVKVLHL
jgi:hypothetical protein